MLLQPQKRILIIDDEYFNIVALQNLIGILSRDIPIDFALNGNTGMDLVISNCEANRLRFTDYQLIITDLSMKPIDGFQLTLNIRNYLI